MRRVTPIKHPRTARLLTRDAISPHVTYVRCLTIPRLHRWLQVRCSARLAPPPIQDHTCSDSHGLWGGLMRVIDESEDGLMREDERCGGWHMKTVGRGENVDHEDCGPIAMHMQSLLHAYAPPPPRTCLWSHVDSPCATPCSSPLGRWVWTWCMVGCVDII